MSADVQAALETHRSLLWGVSYRMLGVAAEADDCVQDAFVRALEHPPRDTTRPMRPWLVTVAMNLARDRLRRRKRRGYPGPFLPSPVRDDVLERLVSGEQHSPERRFIAAESLTYTVLVALEALTPNQRAVWVMRAALGFSVQETADALTLSAANVKTTFHRARRVVQAAPDVHADKAAEQKARALLVALMSRDRDTVLQWLADDVAVITDGGANYSAARHVITGAADAATLLIGVQRFGGDITDVRWARYGRLVGAWFTQSYPEGSSARMARRGMFLVGFDEAGRVARWFTIYPDEKLTGVWDAHVKG